MSDLPKFVHINEEGPREGFQFEKGPIPTARKIELIDACRRPASTTSRSRPSSPNHVPGMADADEVVPGFTRSPASTTPRCG